MKLVSSVLLLASSVALPWASGFVSPSTSVVTLRRVATTISPPTPVVLKSTNDLNDNESNSLPNIDFSKITDAAKKTIDDLSNFDASSVLKNLQSGEFGSRGEIYFAAQAALTIFILIGGIPVLGDPLRIILGPVMLLVGLAVGVLSITDLGSDSLSPFPKPTEEGSLKTTGIYGQMRHPMYTALLSALFGISLLSNSAERLLLTAFLFYLLEVKSEKEEAFLKEQFGQDYVDYQAKVTEKFIPMALLDVLPWTSK